MSDRQSSSRSPERSNNSSHQGRQQRPRRGGEDRGESGHRSSRYRGRNHGKGRQEQAGTPAGSEQKAKSPQGGRSHRPDRNSGNRNQQGGGAPRHRPHRSGGGGRRSFQHSSRERGIESIYRKILELQQLHDNARKKYFELFHRAQPEQQKSLERKFYETLERLRKFEDQLPPQQAEQIAKLKNEKSLDLTYSNNHQIPSDSEVTANAPFVDPHLTDEQNHRPSYAEDTEESVGTMEDYYKLKGTSPVVQVPSNK